MAKKKGITPATTLGGPTSTLGGNIYTGNSSTANAVITTTGTHYPNTLYQYSYTTGYTVAPNVTDGFYEDDGRLFWKNSKGEVFQVTFTKQEVVTNILTDL